MREMPSFENRLLDRINELMAECDMTPTELSERTGIPKSTMSSWFSRKGFPSVAAIYKICDAFQISVAKFFTPSDREADKAEKEKLEKEIWNELPEIAREDYICLLRAVDAQLKRTISKKHRKKQQED